MLFRQIAPRLAVCFLPLLALPLTLARSAPPSTKCRENLKLPDCNWPSNYNSYSLIGGDNTPDTYSFQGEDISPTERYRIERRKVNGVRKATIVALVKGHRYTMDDVSFDQPMNDGGTAHLEPGQTNLYYYFFISPDARWLFVERRCSNHLTFGALYHRVKASDTRMVPVLPQGLRIDEASLRQYATQHQLSARKLGGAARYVHFRSFDMKQGYLFFGVAAAETFDKPGDTGRAWLAAYNLKTGTFCVARELTF